MENTQPSSEKEPKGRIVTFYSYKGGVGRSMALANVAVLLAKMGKKVIVVDFDLEAPGVDKFFKAGLTAKAVDVVGVMGLLHEFRHWNLDEIQDDRIPRIQNLEMSVKYSDDCLLRVLPSGERSSNYHEMVREFSWKHFFENGDGAAKIEWLRDQLRSRYDFILIDSRTGITDIGGVCTVQLPDYLVLVFAANDQNLDGCKRVVEGIHKQRAAFAYDRERLQIIPLLSRFDGRAEKKLAKKWLEKAAKVMQPMLDDWLPKDIPAIEYFDKTKLPHIPKYAFGEEIVCFDERETDPDSLTYYYSAIARLIAGHLQKPARLLSLNRQLGESEIQLILERAANLEQNRASIAQMRSLLASFTGPTAAQAQPMREHIEKLAIHDPDLRDDLESVALNTDSEANRELALYHLKNLPRWTEEDSVNLMAKLAANKKVAGPLTEHSIPHDEPEFRMLLEEWKQGIAVGERRGIIMILSQRWKDYPATKNVLLEFAVGYPSHNVFPDPDASVRMAAIDELGRSWTRHTDVKSGLMLAAFGVSDKQIAPDPSDDVRIRAIVVLCKGWKGDTELGNELLRMAIGVPSSRIKPEQDKRVRLQALQKLPMGWRGEPVFTKEIENAHEVAVAIHGVEGEESKILKNLLDEMRKKM